jgi:hypothetical protein
MVSRRSWDHWRQEGLERVMDTTPHREWKGLHLAPASRRCGCRSRRMCHHKQTDAYQIFLIPQFYSLLWMQMLNKVSDFVFKLPPGSQHWPLSMHKPLFIGVSLPLLTRNPWSLQRMPLQLELERQLRQVLGNGMEDGGDILCKLLQTLRQFASITESVARKML